MFQINLLELSFSFINSLRSQYLAFFAIIFSSEEVSYQHLLPDQNVSIESFMRFYEICFLYFSY